MLFINTESHLVNHSAEVSRPDDFRPSRREAQNAYNQLFLAILKAPKITAQCAKNLEVLRRWGGLSNWEE